MRNVTTSTQYIHPTQIKGEAFTQGGGTVGVKFHLGSHELVIFNAEDDYLEPDERLTGKELVKQLRRAANQLAVILRQEATEDV